MTVDAIKSVIRDIPDFPKEGIIFKDIAPILSDPKVFRHAVDIFKDRHQGKGIDKIAVIEARGFIFGSALAYELGAGLVPVRKQGKLPYEAIEMTYDLEYGTATIEVHVDAVQEGERVLIMDDLLATGGTAAATAALLEKLKADIVEIDFLIELGFLKGREKLAGYDVFAPIVF